MAREERKEMRKKKRHTKRQCLKRKKEEVREMEKTEGEGREYKKRKEVKVEGCRDEEGRK